MPVVSVVITAYNVEQFIADTIRSVLAQTFSDIEIIVVDDGSTDATSEILSGISMSDSRLHIVSRDNGGVSAARNAGLDVASGEYVLFVDGDDLLEPGACSAFLEQALANDADIVVSDYFVRSAPDDCATRISGGAFTSLSGIEFARALLEPGFPVAVWNKLLRRDLFASSGIRFAEDVRMAEDLLALFELSCHARRTIKLDAATIVYIRRTGSLVRTHSPHIGTVTTAMDRLTQLCFRFIGDTVSIRSDLRRAHYYHVVAVRVIPGRTPDATHLHLYRWYRQNMTVLGRTRLSEFTPKLSITELLVAGGYECGYSAGMLMRRAVDFVRSLRPARNER